MGNNPGSHGGITLVATLAKDEHTKFNVGGNQYIKFSNYPGCVWKVFDLDTGA